MPSFLSAVISFLYVSGTPLAVILCWPYLLVSVALFVKNGFEKKKVS